MKTDMTQLDQGIVEGFIGHVAGQMVGAVTTAMIVIGDELGFYATLSDSEPATPSELAGTTNTQERYVREWLAQQAAIGILEHDGASGTFRLPAEHAAVLSDDKSPVSLAGDALMPTALFRGVDDIAEAFRTGNGIAWGDQDEAIFRGSERHYGVLYRNSLVSEWLPGLDGVEAKLAAGTKVADIGTGYGAALILMAQAYPESRFVGYDSHELSIEVARIRAAEAGVADRVRFEVSDASSFPGGEYDLICFFDSFHDLGDPVTAAAHARNALAPDGRLLLVEPFALDETGANIANNPVAAMYYGASLICVSNSLSQPVGLALGAQAGEARLREVLYEGGFRNVERVVENPFNLILEAGA